METIHHLNIAIHVLAGTLALIFGLTAASVNKGSNRHTLFGKYFMWMILIVILTGLIGVFVFRRNNFLLIISLLSGYTCFSGIRAIKLNGQRPNFIDYLAPLMVMSSAVYYLYYINSIGLYWSPTITYSTISALFFVTVYDILKFFMSFRVLQKAVMYEHVYKMISALSAIASAFTGTVLPEYKPYSQLLPSVIALTCIIITFIRLSNKQLPSKINTIPQQAN